MTKALMMAMLIGCAAKCLAAAEEKLDPVARAGTHPIVREKPGPDFFEGALLGNGGLGAVVTTRPDAVVVHFGHNNVWDIRVSEANKEKIGAFREVFDKVKAIPADAPSLESDPWYRDYIAMTQENYRKPYPRPFPCGSLLLGFDRREVELLGYRLDIATGVCAVNLLIGGKPAQLQLFVDMDKDRLWVRLTDAENKPLPNCFERVKLIPDPDAPKDIPAYQVDEGVGEGILSFRQVLPFREPVEGKPGEASPKDRAFRLSVRVNGRLESTERLDWEGRPRPMGALERATVSRDPLVVCVQLDEGLARDIGRTADGLPHASNAEFASAENHAR